MAKKLDMKYIFLVAAMFVIVGVTVGGVLAADDWQVGVSYNVDDTVSYEGVTYECLQAHSSQSDWDPASEEALWEKVDETSGDNNSTGNEWSPGVSYEVGAEVVYDGKVYTVRQAHTSQSDWVPDKVLALYKPSKGVEVDYMSSENTMKTANFTSLDRQSLTEMMDFEYKGAVQEQRGIVYEWSFFKPQENRDGAGVKWIIKPVSVRLSYDTIAECHSEYSSAVCTDYLVKGNTSQVSLNATESPETSVVDNANNKISQELDKAMKLQSRLDTAQGDYQDYINEPISFVVE